MSQRWWLMETLAMNEPGEQPEGFAVLPIWLLRSKKFSRNARDVFLHLSSRVNQHGAAWPSQETLADDSGMGRATVQRALRELREGGLITITVERTPTGKRNVYHLAVDRFANAQVGGVASQ
jgi:DNA-binding transcriptional ArsR family regulator